MEKQLQLRVTVIVGQGLGFFVASLVIAMGRVAAISNKVRRGLHHARCRRGVLRFWLAPDAAILFLVMGVVLVFELVIQRINKVSLKRTFLVIRLVASLLAFGFRFFRVVICAQKITLLCHSHSPPVPTTR